MGVNCCRMQAYRGHERCPKAREELIGFLAIGSDDLCEDVRTILYSASQLLFTGN